MKRIATVGAIITAFAVAPAVAAGGNVAAQSKPQVVGVQVAKVQRAKAAVSVQRHLVQVALAKRILLLRPQLRQFPFPPSEWGNERSRKAPLFIRETTRTMRVVSVVKRE